jgi:hypothetical protein
LRLGRDGDVPDERHFHIGGERRRRYHHLHPRRRRRGGARRLGFEPSRLLACPQPFRSSLRGRLEREVEERVNEVVEVVATAVR